MSLASLKNNVKRLSRMTKPTNDGLSITIVGTNFKASDLNGNSCLFNVGVDAQGRGLITSDRVGDEIVDINDVNMITLRRHLTRGGLNIGQGRGVNSIIKSLAPKIEAKTTVKTSIKAKTTSEAKDIIKITAKQRQAYLNNLTKALNPKKK